MLIIRNLKLVGQVACIAGIVAEFDRDGLARIDDRDAPQILEQMPHFTAAMGYEVLEQTAPGPQAAPEPAVEAEEEVELPVETEEDLPEVKAPEDETEDEEDETEEVAEATSAAPVETTLSKSEIQDRLDAASVSYKTTLTKPQLIKLAEESGVSLS